MGTRILLIDRSLALSRPDLDDWKNFVTIPLLRAAIGRSLFRFYSYSCLNVHERFGARMYVTWDTSKTRHNEVAPNQFELAPILKKQT
jgi:hypothetical protein